MNDQKYDAYNFTAFVWLGGVVVKALDLRLEVAGSNPS